MEFPLSEERALKSKVPRVTKAVLESLFVVAINEPLLIVNIKEHSIVGGGAHTILID